MKSLIILLGLVSLTARANAEPQTAGADPRTPFELRALQQEALDADPRLRELRLEAAKTELRTRNIAAARLPVITLNGQVQYQSDVPTPPSALPSGQPLFAAPKDTYDAYFRVEQSLIDPAIASRRAVERAQLDEAQARVRTVLFGLRQEVNDAFFAAALFQERSSALAATIADLETRLRETSARVREGTALIDDASAVEATLLQRRQDAAEIQANRRAALTRLGELTHRRIAQDDILALPDVTAEVATTRTTLADVRARPEYLQFSYARDRLARQQDLATAQDRPRMTAFARAGYAKPGLNFINDKFETYWLAGVQLQWKAWTWGTTNREREALAMQQQITRADEAAFTDGLRRAVEGDLATIDRLQTALGLDDRIVTLRENIERRTQARFREGVVTAAEYLDRSTELLDAQFARAGHRVEVAQAGARFLTTVGLEVR
jgi:outer membrane protein TolC